MNSYKLTVNEFLSFLWDKGFKLKEEALGFIDFGQKYTATPDYLVNLAIEITLKTKREFDGSFFIALLEMLVEEKITTKKHAYAFVKEKGLL